MDQLKKDEVFEILKNRIVKLEYKAGMILNEVDLAEELNVSRTPIRSAFQKLVSANLISIVPRYGVQVSQIDFIKMKSLFELTRVLDPFATRLAAERISPDKLQELKSVHQKLLSYKIGTDYQKAIDEDENFHEIILSQCGNPWINQHLKELHYHTERLWHYCESYFNDMSIFTYTIGKIIEAIEEKDLDKAEKYAREHIDDFTQKIKEALL
ncbi:MAG: GntR family transcriptional regulator [Filifactoraceae bacterium]